MRKSLFVLLVVMAGLLVGCNGIQVHDNVYDALGGQALKVGDDFQYIGDCDPSVLVSSDGMLLRVNPGTKTRGDVFVREEGETVSEFVIIQRLMLVKTGWHWGPGPGVAYEFGGRTYKLRFLDTTIGDQVEMKSYLDFVKREGVNVKDPRYYVLELSRNVGQQNRFKIYYGIHQALVSEGGNEYEKVVEILMKKFQPVVNPVE